MDTENMKKIAQAFRDRDNFLITAHVNPEGDSIGSQLAVRYLLEKLGKKVCVVDHDVVPDNLFFLPDADKVLPGTPEGFKAETLVLLDCPVKERTGDVYKTAGRDVYMINIDHHVSNEYFADLNWVEPGMSSVGEMVYYLAGETGVGLDKTIAAYLYAAIITDTGMFNYDNTSGDTHRIAGELIETGIDHKQMHSEIYEKKKLIELRILGKVLSTLRIAADGRIAYAFLARWMCEEEGVDFIATDEFVGYPRSIKGVDIAVFFKENMESDRKVNVSFRSTGKADVNTLASRFGGGGHPAASGCMIDGTLDEAIERVLAAAEKAL